jgi:hypothetical protein
VGTTKKEENQMRNGALPLIVLLLTLNMTYPGRAASITLLNNYDATHNIGDVVHLGDADFTGTSYDFLRPGPQGISRGFPFNFGAMGLALPMSGGQFSVYVSQYEANPTRGFFDHLYLNGADLGYLSEDSVVHWYDDGPFTGSNSLFMPGNNTLVIYSGRSTQPGENPSNYDDFEFTNLFIEYDGAIPAPGAILLGTIGAGLVGWMRRRRTL